jgi:hypothetical protein
MALNLNDRMVLMAHSTMQQRVTGACVKYARYLQGGSPSTEQAAWAKGCLDNAADMGRRVSFYILDSADFLGSGAGAITGDTWLGGSDITDVQLQGAVEAAVNAFFIQAAP